MNKVKTLVSKHNFAKVKNQVMEAYMVGVATASGHITVLDPKEKILNKVKIAIFKAFEVSLESTYPIGREREGADIRAIAAYHLYPQYGLSLDRLYIYTLKIIMQIHKFIFRISNF